MDNCSDSVESMNISDDITHFDTKKLESADASMPSAESLGQNYNSMFGDVILNGRKFDVREILGQGAFGTCALVFDYEQNVLLAMKQIHKDHFDIQEINIMQKLADNPFIIKLYGAQKLSCFVRIFMEYAQGGDLHTFLQEHFEQLDNWSKFELFKDIMEGVRFTHSKLIVHADIKSENILLTSNMGGHYRAALGDFGLSLDTTSPWYATMKARGTIRYRSPELCRNPTFNTYSSDIWACGCVLMEIEKGSPPWELAAERGEPSLIFTIGSARRPPIPDNVLDILRPIYEATLAVEWKKRSTARDVCQMLMPPVNEHNTVP